MLNSLKIYTDIPVPPPLGSGETSSSGSTGEILIEKLFFPRTLRFEIVLRPSRWNYGINDFDSSRCVWKCSYEYVKRGGLTRT